MTVVDVLNNNISGLKLTRTDISSAHRLAARGASGRPTALNTRVSKPQPIIVRFMQRSVRNYIMGKCKELKGKRLSITEQLTPNRALLLKGANDLTQRHCLSSAWSHDGRILVKLNNWLISKVLSRTAFETIRCLTSSGVSISAT